MKRYLVSIAFVVGSLACQEPASAPLPPAGIAGATEQAPAMPATAMPSTALPGAGHAVPPPSGDSGATQLPPGHPPIDGAAPTAQAAAAPSGSEATLKGVVLETMDGGGYTYMKLKLGTGETWVAINGAKIAVGDEVTVAQSIEMTNFPSKSLNRTFDKLVMGSLVGEPKHKG